MRCENCTKKGLTIACTGVSGRAEFEISVAGGNPVMLGVIRLTRHIPIDTEGPHSNMANEPDGNRSGDNTEIKSTTENNADAEDEGFKGGLAAVGALLFAVAGGYPLIQAMRGVEELSISPKFVGGSLALIAFGMLECLNIQVIRDDENIRPRDICLIILLGVIGMLCYFGYKKLIESYGYTFPAF